MPVSRRLPYPLYDLWLYPDDSHTHYMIFGCIQMTPILTLWSLAASIGLPYSLYDLWLYPEDSHTHPMIFGFIHRTPIPTLCFFGCIHRTPILFLWPLGTHNHSLIFTYIQTTPIPTLWYLAASRGLPYSLYNLWQYQHCSHIPSMIFGCI